MPLPMPLLAPVTMTECPSIEFSMRPSLPCERGFSPAMERAVMREIWALRDQPCHVYMQNGRKLAAALANAWSVAPGLLIIIAPLVRYIGRPKPCWIGIQAIAVNPIKRAIFQLDLDSPAPAVI